VKTVASAVSGYPRRHIYGVPHLISIVFVLSSATRCIVCMHGLVSVNTYATLQHLTANRGENVSLSCYTTVSESVDWKYSKTEVLPNTTNTAAYVYENHVVHADFTNKVIPHVDDVYYNLTLLNAQPEDSGWYVCREDGGNGKEHAIVLNVSGLII
jgi:Immunoglobulin domain